MRSRDILVKNTTVQGIEIPLPNAMLVLLVAPKGYLMCSYLDIATAEKMGDCAAIIRGVKSIEELLSGTVAATTQTAAEAGITTGMTGYQALDRLL